jgi:hypothetical protein
LLITTTAAAPSEIGDALAAVIVPSGVKAGRSPALVAVDRGGGLAAAARDRRDLLGEPAVALRGGGPLVAAGGEGVLLLAGDAEPGTTGLGGLAHRDARPRVHQAVERGVVTHQHVTELTAGALVGQQMRRIGHRLHAAGHHDVELAGPDQLVGQGDRVQAGEAHLVDGESRRRHRDSGRDGRLPGRDLAAAGLQDLAHDHVLDAGGIETGPGQRGGDGVPAERGGGQVLEVSEEAPHRGPGATDDDGAGHGHNPICATRVWG